jgi:hypothetical protein
MRLRARAQEPAHAIQPGPFQGTRESLKNYAIPQWFRDAKFGIWAHWGPQSAPEAGDWYARNMYMQGSGQYKFHLEHYGYPSKFFKAERWDPDHLMDLYVKAGAKYSVSMGRASRQLRPVELKVSAQVERCAGRAEERHRCYLEGGRAETGAALRRERTSLR